MGTRGAFGVTIDRIDKITYNHFDSYPDGLGHNVVLDVRSMLAEVGISGIKEMARNIRLVNEDDKPTQDDLKKTRHLAAMNGRANEWYGILHDLQGHLRKTLEVGVMIDNRNFLNASLHCEWAYVVNLDTEKLEVYRGFQEKPHANSRFCTADTRPINGYYPVALLAEFPLDSIPETFSYDMEALVRA